MSAHVTGFRCLICLVVICSFPVQHCALPPVSLPSIISRQPLVCPFSRRSQNQVLVMSLHGIELLRSAPATVSEAVFINREFSVVQKQT
jgi:hypothetical protein